MLSCKHSLKFCSEIEFPLKLLYIYMYANAKRYNTFDFI